MTVAFANGVIALFFLFLVITGVQSVVAGEPIRLSAGPHLFVDEYLIEESNSLVRTTHQPERRLKPVISGGPERWHEQVHGPCLGYDRGKQLFRMWYHVKNPGKGGPYQSYAYAESKDGLQWHRPKLGLIDIDGSKDNNLFSTQAAYGLFMVDDGPEYPDPTRRFKWAFFDSKTASGMWVAFSADGLRFTNYEKNAVLLHKTDDPARPVVGDTASGCWDPLRQRYILCYQSVGYPSDGYKGKPPHNREGHRRVVGQSTSKDFIHWTEPRRILMPDPKDPGMWEYYGLSPFVRGDLYIGFLPVFRDDLPADPGGSVDGIAWTELCTSRDGENWTRHPEPFYDRNPKPGTWDHAMVGIGNCVTVDDTEYFCTMGYAGGHKVGERAIGIATLRRNGFVSRDAGPGRGSLRTPLILLEAARLTVNATVEGEMRLRVLDGTGTPIPGFDRTDGAPVIGDSVAHPVTFAGRLQTLRGRPVRLEFSLRDAELYGFDLRAAE